MISDFYLNTECIRIYDFTSICAIISWLLLSLYIRNFILSLEFFIKYLENLINNLFK